MLQPVAVRGQLGQLVGLGGHEPVEFGVDHAAQGFALEDGEILGMLAAVSRSLTRTTLRQSGAATSVSPDTGGAINHQQRRSDTDETQQVMRGNLASDPKYWPATATQDGRSRQAYGEATIYRNRRIQLKDGTYADSPKSSEKGVVKFWGRDAELVHQTDFKSGDPIVAIGGIGELDAYAGREGNLSARSVSNGDSINMNSMRIAASQQATDVCAADATATAQQTYADGFAAPMPAQATGRSIQAKP